MLVAPPSGLLASSTLHLPVPRLIEERLRTQTLSLYSLLMPTPYAISYAWCSAYLACAPTQPFLGRKHKYTASDRNRTQNA
uniref:Uncharacterized protein n=1 Tax=Picea sitchensis TaxID=3332 RepID=A0A6B9XT00_PICSI|nr:hypothetical protein Q903MT_gene6654 [Picea sitchensis]